MPRLSALRLGELDDLAAGLRFAPPGRIIEALSRAIELARTVNPDQLYPEDWLVQRITGYRPDMDEPAMIVGGALLSDLSAFTQRISAQAKLDADSLSFPTLSLEELRQRWSVSSRTIERYRRGGLIALSTRDQAGRPRLAFATSSVEAFEGAHRRLLEKARTVSRLTPSTRDHIVRISQRAQRRYGWSLNETADRIAQRTGRAHETIRQILFQRGGKRTSLRPGDRARAVMHRAQLMGVAVSLLADRYGKSPASVRRIINEHRAVVVRSVGANVEDRAAFVAPNAATKILDPPAARERLRQNVATTADEFVETALALAPPNKKDEQAAARALRFLLWRSRRSVSSPAIRRPTAADLDRAETDLRWALLLVVKLAQTQQPLVVKTIESRLGRSLLTLPASEARSLHAKSMEAIVHAVWGYDPYRGGRLASPVGLAVDRAIANWMTVHRDRLGSASGRARVKNVSLIDWRTRLAPWTRWIEPDPRLIRRIEVVPEPAREVATLAFGLTGEAPMTIEEISSRLLFTRRRMTILLRQALDEVRSA